MTDAPAHADTLRADLARAALLRDIREIKKMGHKMVAKTETAIHQAPLLLGNLGRLQRTGHRGVGTRRSLVEVMNEPP